MKIQDLYKTEYRVSYVNLIRQKWYNGEVWSCIGMPKVNHLLLYLDGCSAEYEMKDGRVIKGQPGDVMYVSAGCEYKARFCYDESKEHSTVGVNFALFGSDGRFVTDESEVEAFSSEAARSLMLELEQLSYSLCDLLMKYNTLIYRIFDTIATGIYSQKYARSGFELIRCGAQYLHKHFCEDVGVEELSAMCNMSSVYFRRLFKEQTGMSPTEYRTHLRLMHGAELLRFGTASVSEISDRLGFVDSAYFAKLFKERYGVSPLAYRKHLKF